MGWGHAQAPNLVPIGPDGAHLRVLASEPDSETKLRGIASESDRVHLRVLASEPDCIHIAASLDPAAAAPPTRAAAADASAAAGGGHGSTAAGRGSGRPAAGGLISRVAAAVDYLTMASCYSVHPKPISKHLLV